ncbi:MAG: FecR domain-containing protein [Anaerolineaceae bacterium]|nr:FecR domain-containing protein [Anaerolineaceae bacterium]
MKKIMMMVLAAVLLLVLPVQPAAAATAAPAVSDPSWRLVEKKMLPDDYSREGWTYRYTVSDGRATYYTSTNDGDALQTSATWSGVKSAYSADEKVEIVLTLSIDSFERKTWNNVGDEISARLDVPGLNGGMTGGGVALLDQDGQEYFQCKAEGGTITVPFRTAVVSAVFRAGNSIGDRRSLYINSKAGSAEYVYEWGSGAAPTVEQPPSTTYDTNPVKPEEPQNPLQELLDRVKTPANDSGVRFSDLSGQVEVCFPLGFDEYGKPVYDEEAWTFAELDMKLPYATKIKTTSSGTHSSVFMLSYPDMTIFITKGDEDIWQLESDPAVDPEKKTSHLKLLTGNLWVNIKKMVKDGSMDIEMSQAVAGIKGTTFVLEEDGTTSTLKVIEGTVSFTSKATGESVMVTGGETVSATKDGLGDLKPFDADAETASWAEYGVEMPSKSFPLWATLAILAILAIAGGVALILVLVVVASRRKKRAAAAMHAVYTQGAYPQPAQSAQPPVPNTFCSQCGSPLSPGATFCRKCGKKREFERRKQL